MTHGYSGLAGKTSLLAEKMAGFSVCHVGVHTFACCHLHCGNGVRDVAINRDKDANWGVGTELTAPSELVVAGPLQETELRQLIRTRSFGGSGDGGLRGWQLERDSGLHLRGWKRSLGSEACDPLLIHADRRISYDFMALSFPHVHFNLIRSV